MSLFSQNGKEMREIPNKRQVFYNSIKSRISHNDFDILKEYIETMILNLEKFNSSQLGSRKDWDSTPELKIILDSCNGDYDESRFFFGLVIWEILIHDHHRWFFYETEDEKGKFYVR